MQNYSYSSTNIQPLYLVYIYKLQFDKTMLALNSEEQVQSINKIKSLLVSPAAFDVNAICVYF